MPGGIHAPIDVVLSWPAANTINPETRPNTIFILAYVFGPITIIMLLARLWVRIFHQRNVGWDDWLILAGIVRPRVRFDRTLADCSRYQRLL